MHAQKGGACAGSCAPRPARQAPGGALAGVTCPGRNAIGGARRDRGDRADVRKTPRRAQAGDVGPRVSRSVGGSPGRSRVRRDVICPGVSWPPVAEGVSPSMSRAGPAREREMARVCSRAMIATYAGAPGRKQTYTTDAPHVRDAGSETYTNKIIGAGRAVSDRRGAYLALLQHIKPITRRGGSVNGSIRGGADGCIVRCTRLSGSASRW